MTRRHRHSPKALRPGEHQQIQQALRPLGATVERIGRHAYAVHAGGQCIALLRGQRHRPASLVSQWSAVTLHSVSRAPVVRGSLAQLLAALVPELRVHLPGTPRGLSAEASRRLFRLIERELHERIRRDGPACADPDHDGALLFALYVGDRDADDAITRRIGFLCWEWAGRAAHQGMSEMWAEHARA